MTEILSVSAFAIVWEKLIYPFIRIVFLPIKLPNKPFSCAPCVSFWLSWFFVTDIHILAPFLTYICATILVRIYDRSTI